MNARSVARLRMLAAVLGLLVLGGCHRGEEPSGLARPAGPAKKPAIETTDYKLVGVVRGVEPEQGMVRIRHEAIPGFMAAMTMEFTLKNKDELEDVRVGDEVEAMLHVIRKDGEVSDYELMNLVVSRPAPAEFTLNLSGNQPEIQATPSVLKPGDPVPDFTMTTQDGKTLRLSDLRGKVVALTFIYTRCPLPDFCPRMDNKFGKLAELIAAVPRRAENVRLLSISFDPENDTPEVLKKHAETRGVHPPLWTFAVASHDELAKVARQLGLFYGPGKNEIIHNLSAAVIDTEGRLVRLETGSAARNWEPADLFRSINASTPHSGE